MISSRKMNPELLERLRTRARHPRMATDAAADWPATAYPPASTAEVEAAEARLRFALPEPVRQVYLHVGNGGFGPAYGLLGLPGGAVNEDQLDCVSLYERFRVPDPDDPHWHWPEFLLPLGHLGCAMYVCVNRVTEEAAIVWFEPNPHEDGESWNDSFIPLALSLESWLAHWLDGTLDALFEQA